MDTTGMSQGEILLRSRIEDLKKQLAASEARRKKERKLQDNLNRQIADLERGANAIHNDIRE